MTAENIRQLLLGWEQYKRDHIRESEALDVESILMSEYSQYAAQQTPPPSATAEEILIKHLGGLMPLKYGVKYNKTIDAMREFAAQQNIKMPTEAEIIEAALRHTTHKSLLPASRGLMKDAFIIGAKWLRNQITEHD